MSDTQVTEPTPRTPIFDVMAAKFEVVINVTPLKEGVNAHTFVIETIPAVPQFRRLDWGALLPDGEGKSLSGTLRLTYTIEKGLEVSGPDDLKTNMRRVVDQMMTSMPRILDAIISTGASLPSREELNGYASHMLHQAITLLLEHNPPHAPRRGCVQVEPMDQALFNRYDLKDDAERSDLEIESFGRHGYMALTGVVDGKAVLAVGVLRPDHHLASYFNQLACDAFKLALSEQERIAADGFRNELRKTADRFNGYATQLEQAFELPTYSPGNET